MMRRTYDVVVERDEDGYFVASVPGLYGCHAQALMVEDLLLRAREAIASCLEVPGSTRLQFVGISRVEVPV
jgi:predicted RNase H-like HicB family nuclease